jgi:hypothetical protein
MVEYVPVDLTALKHAADELIRRKRECRGICKAEEPLQGPLCSRCRRSMETYEAVSFSIANREGLCAACKLTAGG